VIATSGPSTSLTISRTRRALELGADMAMISPDGFGGFPVDDVRVHYNAVADAVDIPIMLQDRTGASLAPSLMAQLSNDHASFRHAKVETLPTPPRFTDTKRLVGNSLALFGGVNGAFLIEELNRGSEGAMASIAIVDVLCEVGAIRVWRYCGSGGALGAAYAPGRDVSLRTRDELLDGERDPAAAGCVHVRLPEAAGAQAG
jgi:hypothetical protein